MIADDLPRTLRILAISCGAFGAATMLAADEAVEDQAITQGGFSCDRGPPVCAFDEDVGVECAGQSLEWRVSAYDLMLLPECSDRDTDARCFDTKFRRWAAVDDFRIDVTRYRAPYQLPARFDDVTLEVRRLSGRSR